MTPLRPTTSAHTRKFWPIFLCLWTVIALIVAGYIWRLEPGAPRLIENDSGTNAEAWWQLFHRNFYVTYPWVLLAPYVLFLCGKFPLGIRPTVQALPLLVLSTAGFLFASITLSNKLERNVSPLVLVDSQLKSFAIAPRVGTLEPRVIMQSLGTTGTNRSSSAASTILISDAMSSTQTRVIKSENFSVEITMNTSPRPNKAIKNVSVPSLPKSMKQNAFSSTKTGIHLGGFLLLAGLAHAGTYYRRYQDRETQSVRLTAQVTKARMAHLQAQLQPHVLFNSLNGISSFVHDQPDQAVEMITHLSDLLRLSLIQPTDNLIPLRNEIEILDHYLALQSMRFGERLQIRRHIDPDTLDIPVPPFVLQPIAENAIRHGIEPLARTGIITLSARCENKQLVLTVEDNGRGLNQASASPGTGTGLPNLAERLASLFPESHSLSMTSDPETTAGTTVTLILPVGKAS